MAKKDKKEVESIFATECDKVGEIAVHYGFSVVIPPKITDSDIAKAKQFKDFDYFEDAEEKIALTRWYAEKNLIGVSQPMMIHYKKPLHGSQHRRKSNEEIYGFEIMGSSKSTSEALLVKTAIAILTDLGYKDLYLGINSIGDRESISKYDREFSSYFKKNISELSAKVRQDLKKNPQEILKYTSPDTESFRDNMPQTIGSLSDASRTYFKEVLEYMESFKINYSIVPGLVANKLFASHTVFEIYESTKKGDIGTLLAYGYRYNYLAKKIGNKKDVQTACLTIIVKKPKANKKVIIKNIKKPSLYLVQLGNTAKLKALNVVEILRKQKIYVYHSITKDKITGQLSGAEYMGATHLLIIGQKEAIEDTVVVRNIESREQETVPVKDLVPFLKKLNIK